MTKKLNNVLNTLNLSFASLGAIYGDIGTSPLYVFSTIFSKNDNPSKTDILGAVSCIFWLFTIVVIFKYALIVLSVGPNNNEGGQIAIYSKIARTLKFGPTGVHIPGGSKPRDIADNDDLLTLTRTNTNVSNFSGATTAGSELWRNFLAKFTLGCCFLGCALVFSDGLLTPTTSVLSAISGIAVAVPSLDDRVMPISCAILIVLFLAQRFGSGKLSLLFSPIVLVWLVCLFVNGIIDIARFHPAIMKGLNPYYAIEYLRRHGVDSFAPVMLAITGTEAMFADVSHFGPLPIQLTLTFFVYPCLMICYFGQAAYLVKHPEGVANVFYLSVPGGAGSSYYWFMFVFATLATIIASQALILGVFCILKQLITLDCFPRLNIVYTSKKHVGRIFIPLANWVLMVCVVLTTVGFKNSNNVTSAYGLGIAIDFLLTTTLIAICMLHVYKIHWTIVVVFFAAFATLDILMVVSGLKKIVHGAWFPLAMAAICFLAISFWRWGRSLKVAHDIRFKKSIDDLFVTSKSVRAVKEAVVLDLNKAAHSVADTEDNSDIENIDDDCESIPSVESVLDESLDYRYYGETKSVRRTPQVGIMYCSSSTYLTNKNFVPQLFEHIVNAFNTVPKVFIIVEPRVSTLPFIETEEQALGLQKIEQVSGFYRCLLRSGFMHQTVLTKELLGQLLESIPETQELLEDEDGGSFVDKNGYFKVPIVHMFEREAVVGRDHPKGMWKLPWRYLRRWLIDYLFSPINGVSNNSTMDYLLPGAATEYNQEIIYLGNRVTI